MAKRGLTLVGGESSTNVERACELLLALSEAGEQGMLLKELSGRIGDNKSAIHRSLVAMARKGFVEPSGARGGYRLGPAVFTLAQHQRAADRLIGGARLAAIEVAAMTEQSTYLMARAGLDAVCVELIPGSSPTQTFTGGAGGRVPLGIGPASCTMLVTLEPKMREAILEKNRPRFAVFENFSMESIVESIDHAARRGFAFEIGQFFPRVGGVAVAIRDRIGVANFAIVVAAHVDQLAFESLPKIASTIEQAIRRHGMNASAGTS